MKSAPRVVIDTGPAEGPLLLVFGSQHGNEPDGVDALQRIARAFEGDKVELRGRLVALVGNMTALNRTRRYVDADLNRIWLPELIARARAGDVEDCSELGELAEILAVVEAAEAESNDEERVFIDLHGTSGPGLPFMLAAEQPVCRFSPAIPLPLILGMEDLLIGTALAHFAGRGYESLAVEGGRNGEPWTAPTLELVVWTALDELGMTPPPAEVEYERRHAEVAARTSTAPSQIWVEHRHEVSPDDGFEMEPGFENLQLLEANRLIARDNNREYRAKREAWLLFPRYQGEGCDGFFLGSAVDEPRSDDR